MSNLQANFEIIKSKLNKALKHLEYSYKKTVKLPVDTQQLDEEGLEVWESFAARFSRVAEIFLTKYGRVLISI